MYHITNFQACGLCANVKKLENLHWIYPVLALIYFQRPQIKKKLQLDNLKFSNEHEITEFEDEIKQTITMACKNISS